MYKYNTYTYYLQAKYLFGVMFYMTLPFIVSNRAFVEGQSNILNR